MNRILRKDVAHDILLLKIFLGGVIFYGRRPCGELDFI